MNALLGFAVLGGGLALYGIPRLVVAVHRTWQVLTHPRRQRHHFALVFTDPPHDGDPDGLRSVDWQDHRYVLLDDLCAIAAGLGWRFADQAVYHDRWQLRFRYAGAGAVPGDRAPAAMHNHPAADPCTCTGTDHLFGWEDPADPVDDRIRIPRTVRTWPGSPGRSGADGRAPHG